MHASIKWLIFIIKSCLVIHAKGDCRDDTVFFGDLDLQKLPIYQIQVVSALGVYRKEANSVGLLSYRHSARPDIFLLREPPPATAPEASRKLRWVIATLPDSKKPSNVSQAHEAWPDTSNILVEARFTSSDVPWNKTGWRMASGCGEGQIIPSLALRCPPRWHFGQCSSGVWNVTIDGPVPPSLANVRLLQGVYQNSGKLSHGRPVYSSGVASLSVNDQSRWVLQHSLDPAASPVFVSSEPAERLEFVTAWTTSTGTVPRISVTCAPLPVTSLEVCSNSSCANGGSCYPAGDGFYQCWCRFDAVSPGCKQIRECSAPPRVVNGQLVFTSDLSLHGKAFYKCDVGYSYRKSLSSSTSSSTSSGETAAGDVLYGICDGTQWLGIPHCAPAVESATIEDAYIHQCNFDSTDSQWCNYDHSAHNSLQQLISRTSAAVWTLDKTVERGHFASASDSSGGQGLARLRSVCIFLPVSGCLVFDARVSAAAQLSVNNADSGDIWWRTGETAGGDWTSVSLPLAAGAVRFSLDARLSASTARVAVDNIRVFQWNCTQTGALLFGTSFASPGPSASSALLFPPIVMILFMFLHR